MIVAARPARTIDPIAVKFFEKNNPRVARGDAASASSAARRQTHVPLPSASGTGAPSSVRNPSAAAQTKRLLAEQLEAAEAREPCRLERSGGHQRQFQRAGRNLRRKLDGRFTDDRHFHQRMAPVETSQDLGQERLGVVVRNPKPDRASEPLARHARRSPRPRPG